MGIFNSMKRRSSSFKDTDTVRSNRTSFISGSSKYGFFPSRNSSAPTSRCSSPISRTRSDELSSIISRSIIYPTPSSTSASPVLSPEQQTVPSSLVLDNTHQRLDDIAIINTKTKKQPQNENLPQGFRSFLDDAKKSNPNYRDAKLNIMKPISNNDKFGLFMQRKRSN
ncbi:uncharacterized protein L201_003487 [Kwoniella dendrophila CBS 6074]|uniref:Uncharacterized protein n=1 Tax=Kwoniella dendrophila CBS 6074 TaxID=1295534 RepID=A0AAX4JVK9_9TREE